MRKTAVVSERRHMLVVCLVGSISQLQGALLMHTGVQLVIVSSSHRPELEIVPHGVWELVSYTDIDAVDTDGGVFRLYDRYLYLLCMA